MVDERNFRALAVRAGERSDADSLASALGGLGHIVGTHAWLSIHGLRALGPPDSAWKEGFDAMIAFADRSGWVSEDKAFVRAHMESSE